MSDHHVDQDNPYVGPRSYRAGEKLYGRARERMELLDLLIAERIVLLYSPSGAGKTSLVHATLVPEMTRERFFVMPSMRVNQDLPPVIAASAPDANRYVVSALLAMEDARPADEQLPLSMLAELSLDQYLLEHAPAGAADNDGIFLIFDQFEEVLTVDPTDRDQKIAFFQDLGRALRNRNRWALFVMREDFIAGLDPYLRYVPTRLSNTYRLELLAPDQALLAVQQPAREAGVTFTDAAARKLIDDLRMVRVQQGDGTVALRPGLFVEPVQLQVVCHRLWHLTVGHGDDLIDVDDLETVGDVGQALAGYYDERVAEIAADGVATELSIRKWFDRELITEQGIRGQVLQEPDASSGLNNDVIERLVNAYLVRADQRRGAVWYELAHDRLIEPIQESNRAWYEPNLSTFQRRAALWQDRGRPDNLLIADRQSLTEAEAWVREHADDLTAVEEHYLRLSRDAVVREQQKERRRLTQIAVGATALSILALVATLFAFVNLNRAQTARAAAETEEAKANAALADAESARATVEIQATAEAAARTEADMQREAAVAAQATSEAIAVALATQVAEAEAARSEADTQREAAEAAEAEAESAQEEAEAAAASARENLSGLLAAQAENLFDTNLSQGLLLAVEALRADDTFLARSALLSGLQASLQTSISFQQALEESFPNYAVAYSPDGQYLVTGGSRNTPVVWDGVTGEQLRVLRDLESDAPVRDITFTTDGAYMISITQSGRIIVWRTSNWTALPSLTHFGTNFYAVEAIPDSRRFITAGDASTALVWEIGALSNVDRIELGMSNVRTLSFKSDGTLLLVGGEDPITGDGEVGLFTVPNWSRVTQSVAQTANQDQEAPFTGHAAGVREGAFIPNSDRLVTGDEDGEIIIWDVTGRSLTRLAGGHRGAITALAVSPSGRALASGGSDRQIVLWDLTTGQISGQPVTNQNGAITGLVYRSDGNRLASVSLDGTRSAVIWEVVASRQILGQTLSVFGGAVNELTFDSATGRLASLACATAACATGEAFVFDGVTFTGEVQITSTLAIAGPVAFAPDGVLVALPQPEERGVTLYDTATGALLATYDAPEGAALSALAFSPGGDNLEGVYLLDQRLYNWLGSGGELPADFSALDAAARLLDLPPASGFVYAGDGAALATLGSEAVFVETDNWSAVADIAGRHGAPIRAATIAGDVAATVDESGLILLWDRVTWTTRDVVLSGLGEEVTGLGLIDDGRMLVGADSAGGLVIWDTETGRLLTDSLPGHRGPITAVAVAADNVHFATASVDGTVIVWEAQVSSWESLACTVAGENLTQTAWERFFSSEPYAPTCPEYGLPEE